MGQVYQEAPQLLPSSKQKIRNKEHEKRKGGKKKEKGVKKKVAKLYLY